MIDGHEGSYICYVEQASFWHYSYKETTCTHRLRHTHTQKDSGHTERDTRTRLTHTAAASTHVCIHTQRELVYSDADVKLLHCASTQFF